MRTLLLLLATLATLLGCYKENEYYFLGLPEPTQSGENTFGCLINGKPWVAEIDPGVFDPTARKISSSYNELEYGITDDFSFQINAQKLSLKDSISDYFNINIRPVYNKSVININDLVYKDLFFITSVPGSGPITGWYTLDTLSAFRFEITNLNIEDNVCSGILRVFKKVCQS